MITRCPGTGERRLNGSLGAATLGRRAEQASPPPYLLRSLAGFAPPLYRRPMNARTSLSASGNVAIPADVRARLGWGPDTPLELVETADGIRLRKADGRNPFPPKTMADLDALPPLGPPQPIEAISRLSDEDIRRLLDESD
jgi:AbrB family looped-hinge helix DNA binding protein